MISFVPTFRHYRAVSVLGIFTTTYTAWYMTIISAIEGPADDVEYGAPGNVEDFFNGFMQLLFVFDGGHTSNIEVTDVMDNPGTYDKSYFWSYLYVFSLTMPNAVTAYHGGTVHRQRLPALPPVGRPRCWYRHDDTSSSSRF